MAINEQDLQGLEWQRLDRLNILTAMGETRWETFLGKVAIDSEEFTVPVVAGSEFRETIIGIPWLRIRRLVVDFPAGVLTLG